MKLYLGVTDTQWFRFLRAEQPEEVNFWQPGGSNAFKVLPVGGPFLFKLKAPLNAIGGLGFFASHTRLPLSIAWEFFGRANGLDTYAAFRDKIIGYRHDGQPNPVIGCIVLADPVFFEQEDWIPVPANWSPNIVQGKSYDTTTAIGKEIWSKVQYTLQRYRWMERQPEAKRMLVMEPGEPEYREVLSRVRVGQGTFRTLITDAYQRRCAISGEKTLPALEAAHIKPYAESGPHAISNGLLLRSDLHKLFDSGYMTVTPEHRILVSSRIKEEFENGREYYRYDGKPMLILPEDLNRQPDPRYIQWHNEQVFNG